MAVYSARLATVTTLLGLVFGTTAREASWQVPAIFAVALVTLSAVSIVRTMRQYDDPVVRARVVAAVSSG
jgi:Na+-translocating ferredoxin:NAD+ oxidoreductase RnfD subunit